MRTAAEHAVQRLAVATLIAAAALACLASAAAAAGLIPWLTVPLFWGATALPQAGMALQLGLTALLLLLALALPSVLRVLALERSHRDFSLAMSDVAEAYHLCHAADRQGIFTLRREYDAMRERLEHMRHHPSLAELDAEVLTAAAQMSTVSRDLAETYSDAALARAKAFLSEREAEIVRFRSRIAQVLDQTNALRRHIDAIALEESLAASQLRQIEDQLGTALQDLARLKSEHQDQAQRPDLQLLRPAE